MESIQVNRTVAASYPEGTEPRSLYVVVAGSVAKKVLKAQEEEEREPRGV